MEWVVNATSRLLYPRKRPGTQRTGSWVNLAAGLDGRGKSRLPPGFDPPTVQPIASRYTDWAIPAHERVNELRIQSCGTVKVLRVSDNPKATFACVCIWTDAMFFSVGLPVGNAPDVCSHVAYCTTLDIRTLTTSRLTRDPGGQRWS
jgi:hypothetical protein